MEWTDLPCSLLAQSYNQQALPCSPMYPKVSLYEFKQEVQKRQSGLSGAVEEVCWEGLPVGPDVFLTQDLLHGCYKFVWDHVAKWLNHMIGEAELDLHFRPQPTLAFRGF